MEAGPLHALQLLVATPERPLPGRRPAISPRLVNRQNMIVGRSGCRKIVSVPNMLSVLRPQGFPSDHHDHCLGLLPFDSDSTLPSCAARFPGSCFYEISYRILATALTMHSCAPSPATKLTLFLTFFSTSRYDMSSFSYFIIVLSFLMWQLIYSSLWIQITLEVQRPRLTHNSVAFARGCGL